MLPCVSLLTGWALTFAQLLYCLNAFWAAGSFAAAAGFATFAASIDVRTEVPIAYPVVLGVAPVHTSVTVSPDEGTLLDPFRTVSASFIGPDLLRDRPGARTEFDDRSGSCEIDVIQNAVRHRPAGGDSGRNCAALGEEFGEEESDIGEARRTRRQGGFDKGGFSHVGVQRIAAHIVSIDKKSRPAPNRVPTRATDCGRAGEAAM